MSGIILRPPRPILLGFVILRLPWGLALACHIPRGEAWPKGFPCMDSILPGHDPSRQGSRSLFVSTGGVSTSSSNSFTLLWTISILLSRSNLYARHLNSLHLCLQEQAWVLSQSFSVQTSFLDLGVLRRKHQGLILSQWGLCFCYKGTQAGTWPVQQWPWPPQ